MLTILLAAAVLLAACGSSTPKQSVPQLLSAAREAVNATPGVRFALTSQNLPNSTTTLRGGTGDLVRPGQLKGTFQVTIEGLPASVKLISVGGKFYAELPFTSHYQVIDPAEFGIGDPASVLNPKTGVSGLLTEVSGARAAGQQRLNGELLDLVTGTVPGKDVTGFLPDVDPAKTVALTFFIDPSSHQVRKVKAEGPFVKATVTSTYVVILTHYGERVKITAPPA